MGKVGYGVISMDQITKLVTAYLVTA